MHLNFACFTFKVSQITLGSGRKVSLVYDSHAGLRHVVLASGGKHSISCQPSMGFIRFTYTPPGKHVRHHVYVTNYFYSYVDGKLKLHVLPGSTKSYLLHFTHAGKLLQVVYPGDGARVIYRYHPSGQLAEVS